MANRKASVRVGNETFAKKAGYFEDRRPAANMDPYLVTGMIFDTCILNAKFAHIWPSPGDDIEGSDQLLVLTAKKKRMMRGKANGCAVIM